MSLSPRTGIAAASLITLLGALAIVLPTHSSRAAGHVAARSYGGTVQLPPHHVSPPPQPPAHIVVLGDSVTTGAGCECVPFGRLLAREVIALGHRPARLALLGHDGLTSSGLLAQLRQDPGTVRALQQATTVTVTIGANDFDSSEAASGCAGAGTACYAADLQALPAELSAVLYRIRSLAGPQVQVLVTGYWNVFLDGALGRQQGATYQATSDALTRDVDAVLAKTARAQGASYVDLYRAFRGDGDIDDTALLASDGDHPSEAGHRLIARLLARSIVR